MAILLVGEKIAERMQERLAAEKKELHLVAVQVGSNAVSERYLAEKKKAAVKVGVRFSKHSFPQDIAEEDLKREIAALAAQEDVHGIVVQLPLPRHLSQQAVLDEIPEGKDPDVLSSTAFGKFALGSSSIVPPTAHAVALLLEEHKIAVKGKRALLVGAGRLVGLPLAFWFLSQKATLTIADKYTENLKELSLRADIVVAGTGKAGLITGDMIREGAVVVDAGTSVEAGATKGDVDFESVSQVAGYITPVPGGVGPLTVACLFQNLWQLQK